ncbi:MAG: hemerythrin domain-containing protein [Gammaproteobacteria bacterium]
MSNISQYMTEDHRSCDGHFAAAEEAVNDQQWEEANQRFARFEAAMERHLGMEENILFPEFERVTGNTMGPTQMMRMEHGQMRDLIQQMRVALASQDADTYLGVSETLLVMMQQHNVKEEQILYPMTDQALGDSDVLNRLQQG